MPSMQGVLTAFGVAPRPSREARLIAHLVRWLILVVAVWVAATVVPGITLDGWQSTLIVAGILGLLNVLLRPTLVLLSLPVTVLTLGLFLLILNTAMLALTAWIAGEMPRVDFAIDGFWAAFTGALIITVVSWLLGWLATRR